jgi:hydrogenase maturation protein HypF
VGFRPFVWQLAQQLSCAATSATTATACWCALSAMTPFLAALTRRCPPLARIDSAAAAFVWAAPPPGFTIRQSGAGSMRTQIVPDAATCPACLAEMNNPRAPLPLSVYQLHPLRAALYHYSRHALRPPADRYVAVSSLARLRGGISRSADRRFHAQPVACADCGPQLEWRGPQEH